MLRRSTETALTWGSSGAETQPPTSDCNDDDRNRDDYDSSEPVRWLGAAGREIFAISLPGITLAWITIARRTLSCVCKQHRHRDPRKNALLKDGSKNDRIDARQLAELLRGNQLSAV
jgi:hypothetical protein